MRLIVTLLIFSVLTSGCKNAKEKRIDNLTDQASETGMQFFEFRKNENFPKTYSLFSAEFKEKHTDEELWKTFSDIQVKYGRIVTVSLNQKKYTTTFKDGAKKVNVSCAFLVSYSNNYVSRETLTFDIRDTTKSLTKIDGYRFEDPDVPSE